MINGKTVQQSEVQNMFHSVQLNVNNPHFLIMQGRITKVLNMKPVEILSMIEEAAGTRMFQTKKEQAMKTIEKKQLKVDELSKCMNDEINPQLESLREQRQSYMTYQTNGTQLERLDRFCIGYEFNEYEKMVDKQDVGRKVIDDEKIEKEKKLLEVKTEATKCAENIEAMEQSINSTMKSELIVLKSEEEDLSKDLVKAKTTLKNHLETMTTEKESVTALEKQLDTAQNALKEKESEMTICHRELLVKETEVAEVDSTSSRMREKYQNAVAGVADESEAEVLSLPEQVATWEKKLRESQSALQQGSQKSEHIKKTLKELQNTAKTQQSAHNTTLKEMETLKKAISLAEDQKSSMTNVDGLKNIDESALQTKATVLRTSVAALQDDVDRITTQLEARLNFEFKDPEKGFDRSRVKGLVARLVSIPNPQDATALEVSAGSKLYQVVVDNEATRRCHRPSRRAG